MRVLFVCQRNNGRSQMAKSLYNKLSGSNDADSAGLTVDKNGQLLKDRANEPGSDVAKVIQVMAEEGVDVSDYARTQFNKDMLGSYDKIVVLLEPANVPKLLIDNPKVEMWDIEDPKTKDLNGVRDTKDTIRNRIIKMI